MLKQRSLITTSMLLAAVSTIGATATTANSNFVSGTGLSSPEIENSRKLAVMDVFIDDFAAAMVQKSAEKNIDTARLGLATASIFGGIQDGASVIEIAVAITSKSDGYFKLATSQDGALLINTVFDALILELDENFDHTVSSTMKHYVKTGDFHISRISKNVQEMLWLPGNVLELTKKRKAA